MDSKSPNPQDTTSVLRNATFTRNEPVVTDRPVTASDVLLGSFDPAKLHPMAGIEDKLDYLLLDDDKTSDLPGSEGAIPSRGWSDDLSYGTGTMYLGGMLPFPFFSSLTSCRISRFNFFDPRPRILFTSSRCSHLIGDDALSYCLCTITCLLFFLSRSRPRWRMGLA